MGLADLFSNGVNTIVTTKANLLKHVSAPPGPPAMGMPVVTPSAVEDESISAGSIATPVIQEKQRPVESDKNKKNYKLESSLIPVTTSTQTNHPNPHCRLFYKLCTRKPFSNYSNSYRNDVLDFVYNINKFYPGVQEIEKKRKSSIKTKGGIKFPTILRNIVATNTPDIPRPDSKSNSSIFSFDKNGSNEFSVYSGEYANDLEFANALYNQNSVPSSSSHAETHLTMDSIIDCESFTSEKSFPSRSD